MPPFTSLTITAIGDFGSSASPTKLRQWVELNGGKWAPKLTEGVTHAIVGKGEWKRRVDGVRQAQEAGIWVLSYDWLEDSLQRKRKLAEKKFTWEYLRERKKKGREVKRLGRLVDEKVFTKGCEEARVATGSGTSKSKPPPAHKSSSHTTGSGPIFKSSLAELKERRESRARETASAVATSSPPSSTPTEPVSTNTNPDTSASQQVPKTEKLTDNYHVYRDHTGFDFNILLIRSNLAENKTESYNIRLFESNTIPHMYCTFIRYTPPANTPSPTPTVPTTTSQPTNSLPADTNIPHPEALRTKALLCPPPYRTLLTPPPAPYHTAYTTFRHAFRDLTFLPWELRHSPSARFHQQRLAAQYRLEPFVYRKPGVGLPIGQVYEVQNNGFVDMEEWPFKEEIIDGEKGYIRGKLGLPGMERELGGGSIGMAVLREEDEERKRKELAAKEAGQTGNEQGGDTKAPKLVLKLGVGKRESYNKPLFNGVRGKVRFENEEVGMGVGVKKEKGSGGGGGGGNGNGKGTGPVKKEDKGDMGVKLRLNNKRAPGSKRWEGSAFFSYER